MTTPPSTPTTERAPLGRDGQHRRPRHARARRRLRRAPPAGRGADRRLRALRVLPADLPDLRAVGRGDGLPARTDLPDEGRSRGRAHERLDGVALGRLPRLHGVRDRRARPGVQYDTLIEQTRAQVERRHERSAKDKALRGLIFSLFPYPQAAQGCCAARCAPCRRPASTGRCGAPDCSTARPPARGDGAARAPAGQAGAAADRTSRRPGTRRAVVGLLTGCVQGAFFPGVNAATARVLQAEGCDVVVPKSQGCCGALSVHNGREPEGQAFARKLIDSFERLRGRVRRGQRGRLRLHDEGVRRRCWPTTRSTPNGRASFADRVRDVAEILDELGPVAPRHPLELTVAYHDACHLGHAQGIRAHPDGCSRPSRGSS